MAYTLTITDDQSSPVSEDLSAYLLADSPYTPTCAPKGEQFVTETLRFKYTASTLDNIRALVYQIGNHSWQADRRNREGKGPRIYITLKWEGSETAYRSEILSADYVLDERALGPLLNNRYQFFDLTFTRRNYWESTSAVTATLTKFYDTDVIYNTTNTVTVANVLITGVLSVGDTKVDGTLPNYPLKAGASIHVTFADADTATLTTTGAGTITGDHVTAGTLNHITGVYSITFSKALENPLSNFKIDCQYGWINYVEFTPVITGGEMPVPLIVELTNKNASKNIYNVWVGTNHTDTTLNWILEAEDATGPTVKPAAPGDAQYSGLYYGEYAIGADTTEHDMFDWTIPSANVTKASGGNFHAYGRLVPTVATDIQSVKTRWKFTDGTNTLWSYEQIKHPAITTSIIDLGVIRLPPWTMYGETAPALHLILTGQAVDTSTYKVEFDYVQLIPCDSFGAYAAVTPVVQNNRVVMDGVDGRCYTDAGSGAQTRNVLGEEYTLWAWPNKINRLYFIVQDNAAVSSINWQSGTVVKYYPRRTGF